MKLEGTISLHQQKATQLQQWSKQGQAYQTWNQEPQTVDMKLLSFGLSSPQIQERIANINQKLQQQTQSTRGQTSGDRGQGGLSV